MSHLHIPDGVLPLWLWSAGWVAALAVVWLTGTLAGRESRRRVPLIAAVAALMLVAMSSEVVPIAYHINLTVAAGALIGPVLAPIAAFIVVLVLALLGHGGLTVVGLNTLVIASEMVIGWLMFTSAVRVLRSSRVRVAAVLATVITLAITTSMVVGIVWLGGSGATTRETGALDPSTLKFESPFGAGIFAQGLFSGGEQEAPPDQAERLSVRRFATTVFLLGPVGWVLEAFVTALVLGYVARVRPSLLFGGVHPDRRLLGDESGGH